MMTPELKKEHKLQMEGCSEVVDAFLSGVRDRDGDMDRAVISLADMALFTMIGRMLMSAQHHSIPRDEVRIDIERIVTDMIESNIEHFDHIKAKVEQADQSSYQKKTAH